MTLPGRQVTGVRRILNNAADRALAAGPPTRAQEAWYAATWAGTLALAVVLPIICLLYTSDAADE